MNSSQDPANRRSVLGLLNRARWNWDSWTIGCLILGGLAVTLVASVIYLSLQTSDGVFRPDG